MKHIYFERMQSFSVAVYNMNVEVGDIVVMKKNHPCGNNEFDVLRVGMDFKIRCRKCEREVMVPRSKAEKNIKKIMKEKGDNNA